MSTSPILDLEGLAEGIAQAIHTGVLRGIERVERDFGPAVAAALRGAVVAPRAAPAPVPQIEDLPLPGYAAGRLEPRARRGERRSRAELEVFEQRVLATIREHPGLTAEGLSAQLGVPTADLRIPLARLQGRTQRGQPIPGVQPQIRSEGAKKSTAYLLVEAKDPGETRKRAAGTR